MGIAVRTQSVPVVKFFLEQNCSPRRRGAYGYTAVHEAAFCGYVDVVKALLEHQGNVDALSKNGSTALLVASREGHADVVEILIRFGADPDDGGDKSWSPLQNAASQGR